jgi:cell division septum initiation protein DivIVA
MKSATMPVFFLALLAGASGSAVVQEAKVTPVQKVLELLNGMLAQGKDAKYGEQVQFASFKQFCTDTATEKTRLIAEANEKIERLNADIDKYTSDAAILTKEIAAHDEDISVWNGDLDASGKVRHIEKTTYDETHKDYSESISALGRAITVLKQQAYDRKQASFVQLSSLKSLTLIPEKAKKTIDAFLAQDPELGEPEAIGYEFQSHGVIEMLEKLLDKFTAELTQLEKEERDSLQAYQILVQDLDAEIAESTAQRNKKTEVKAAKLEAKAQAEADVAATTAARDADQKYLDDLNATCAKKTTDYESRQKLRAEEIVAIEKAIEIIGSAAVSANADINLPTLLQTKKSSLVQFASDADAQGLTRARVTMYLQTQAKMLNSRVLSMVATRAAADPFAKVKKMIKDLITRLMEEAGEESDHKAWCDAELSTNEQVRKEKTEMVETLHAESDELKAKIAKLEEEIADLTQAVADLVAAMAEATTLRSEEKAKNEKSIADAKMGQEAVAQALTVLKEYYAHAGEATALVQEKKQPVPEIFETSYKGMQAEAGGVVGMLEVIESDFARLEAETAAAEETAVKEYETFMADSKADKAAKQKEIEDKGYKLQDEKQALIVASESLEGYQTELDAALVYFDKLKPSCIEVGVSYDDRVSRRKEEIASLQEALEILNGQGVGLVEATNE